VFVSSCVLHPGHLPDLLHPVKVSFSSAALDLVPVRCSAHLPDLLHRFPSAFYRMSGLVLISACIDLVLGCCMREHFVTSAERARAVPLSFHSWSSPPVTSFWSGLSRSCACCWFDSVADSQRQETCFLVSGYRSLPENSLLVHTCF
jgi:hypothetical protein